jgi:hypothetical protein
MAPKPSPDQKPKSDVDPYANFFSSGGDPDLIAIFKDVTKGKPDATLGNPDAQKILKKLLEDPDSAITEKEALTMNDILLKGNFEGPASDLLANGVISAIKSEALIRGSFRIPGNSTMISGVTDFLGAGKVGHLKFASPGTKIVYTPHHYLSIKQLIEDGKIAVYKIAVSWLNQTLHTDAGDYFSHSNRLVIYDNFDQTSNAATTIHEATHAVQDWLDVKTTVRFAEADAYIAGGVAGSERGWTTKSLARDTPYVAVFEGGALDLVRKGQANDPNDKKWNAAYTKVTDAVAGNKMYRSIIDNSFAPDGDDLSEGEDSEEKRYNAVLQTIIKKFPEKAAEVKKVVEKPAKNKKK